MDTCDVLIVGGGPAGSACAWSLRNAGLQTMVADAASFPRDKVCAGWITPQVVNELHLDIDEYRKTRVLQPVFGFHVGLVDGNATCRVDYTRPVSFAIRRCEFDHYLLTRSGARTSFGARVSSIRRVEGRWIVDDRFAAPMLVGAGGHWCPVARLLNPHFGHDAVIAAREFECLLGPREAAGCRVEPGIVEIYFARDLSGYGWCVRKRDYLNVGFGSYGEQSVPSVADQFVGFLTRTGRIPAGLSYRWRGHAYSTRSRPRLVDEGVLLTGDAAGIADPRSGEGIRPAVESGLLAGSAIVDAVGGYTAERLAPYGDVIRRRFDAGAQWSQKLWDLASEGLAERLSSRLLRAEWFVRHIVLDRWFLHAAEPPLVPWSTLSMRSEVR